MSTIKLVRIEFDPAKSERNLAERGLPFEAAADFEFGTALLRLDDRIGGEIRVRALGLLGDRVHALVYTARGDAIRVISFRKANRREQKEFKAWLDARR